MFNLHQPVLLAEVVAQLSHRPDGILLDGTVGTGGHAEALLRSLSPQGRLICLDQDPDCLVQTQQRLQSFGNRVSFHRGSFSELGTVLAAEGVAAVDGVLLDLGLNTWSLARPAKGLSYQTDGPLRMNVDPDLPLSAAEWVEGASEAELVRVFTEYGGVRRPRLYARRVLTARERQTLRTTYELVRAFSGGNPGDPGPAELSRLFQALRVEICREMERLEAFLAHASEWILPGGRLAILTYASQEARRVKQWARSGGDGAESFVALHRQGLKPGAEELRSNRRARSARLRVFERRGAG